MMKIKKAVDKLEDGDKIIFIMYCECGSMRDLGKQLGVSHTAIWKIITKIKKQILNDIGYIDD
jgi:transcriptional regulator of aromatic amino acid metabolism